MGYIPRDGCNIIRYIMYIHTNVKYYSSSSTAYAWLASATVERLFFPSQSHSIIQTNFSYGRYASYTIIYYYYFKSDSLKAYSFRALVF